MSQRLQTHPRHTLLPDCQSWCPQPRKALGASWRLQVPRGQSPLRKSHGSSATGALDHGSEVHTSASTRKLKFTWICSLDKWTPLCFSGYFAHSDYGDNCYAVYVSTSRLHSKHFCVLTFQGPSFCSIREWHTYTHASPVWRASSKRAQTLTGNSVQPTGFETRYTLEFRKRMLL